MSWVDRMRDAERRKRETRLATTTPQTFVVMQVYHTKGGPDYARGGMIEPGYYISARSKKIEKGPAGLEISSWAMFGGCKAFLAEGKRFSEKTLDQLFANIEQHELYKACLAKVLENDGLTLTTTVMTFDPNSGKVSSQVLQPQS